MPLSTMSAASSGGVFSSATFTASTMADHRFGQAVGDLPLADDDFARDAVHQVAAADFAVRARHRWGPASPPRRYPS